jgi:hypothetical protein
MYHVIDGQQVSWRYIFTPYICTCMYGNMVMPVKSLLFPADVFPGIARKALLWVTMLFLTYTAGGILGREQAMGPLGRYCFTIQRE